MGVDGRGGGNLADAAIRTYHPSSSVGMARSRMRGKWHLLLFATALGSAGLAVQCQLRARAISAEAELEQQRSSSSGASFVSTFSGEFVDAQLGQLDHRRSLISSASHWREASLFALVGVVFFAFAGYTVRSVETLVDDEFGGSQPLPASPRI